MKKKNPIARWLWNLFIAIDQFFNALLLGDPDETISSRMGKHMRNGHCRLCLKICKWLHKLDPEHCQKSIENDEGKDQITRR